MFDHRTHGHVMGGTQSGKSKFIEACCRKHVEEGNGFCVLDWHGTLYEALAEYLAYRRPKQRVILLDPGSESIVPWNPFRKKDGTDISKQAGDLVELLANLSGMETTDQAPNFREYARTLFTYMAATGEPLQNASLLLEPENISLRASALETLKDYRRAQVSLNNISLYTKATQYDFHVGSTRNRIGRLLDSRAIVRTMGMSLPGLDLDQVIEDNAIVLVNLSPAKMDAEAARTFAALLLAEFMETALTNAGNERPYFVYCDECQNYLTRDAARLLDQSIKSGLRFTFVHHHMGQFTDPRLIASLETNAQLSFLFAGLPVVEAERYAKELFLRELNREKVRRERTRFITEHELEAYETSDESESSSDGGTVYEDGATSNFSSTSGSAMHYGTRYAPRLREIPDTPEVWGREEKLGQLSERLTTLTPGQCWIKTPAYAFFHEVPYVTHYFTKRANVLDFLKRANKLAISGDEADRIIRQQEQDFIERSRPNAPSASVAKTTRAKKRPARLHPQE